MVCNCDMFYYIKIACDSETHEENTEAAKRIYMATWFNPIENIAIKMIAKI